MQTSSPGSPVCRGHGHDRDDHEGREVMLMIVIVGINGVSILVTSKRLFLLKNNEDPTSNWMTGLVPGFDSTTKVGALQH